MKSARHIAIELASVCVGAAAVSSMVFVAAMRIAAARINIVTADSLYLPLLFQGHLLDFRTPSSTYVFPDLLYFGVAHAISADSGTALIAAGLIQYLVTNILVIRYCGILACSIYNLLYFTFGLEHYF